MAVLPSSVGRPAGWLGEDTSRKGLLLMTFRLRASPEGRGTYQSASSSKAIASAVEGAERGWTACSGRGRRLRWEGRTEQDVCGLPRERVVRAERRHQGVVHRREGVVRESVALAAARQRLSCVSLEYRILQGRTYPGPPDVVPSIRREETRGRWRVRCGSRFCSASS